MADREPPAEDDRTFHLEDFAQPSDDAGLSLEALSSAYAALVGGGSVPYEDRPEGDSDTIGDEEQDDNADPAEVYCDVTPSSILEAMLFVGNPQNEPLTSQQVGALMRGVRPQEIDELVRGLNEQYEREGCPYRIVSVGAGYVLQLREQYGSLRDKFYGRIREARLSQAAIDILAIVAYGQPVTREEIDRFRGRPCGAVLSQLVRRQLLRLERDETKPRRARYYTTERFLKLFGIQGLAELPQADDLERDF